MGLYKRTALCACGNEFVKNSPSEKLRLTFMAEAQNLMKRPNFNDPSANLSAPGSFAVICSTKGYAGAHRTMLRGRIDF